MGEHFEVIRAEGEPEQYKCKHCGFLTEGKGEMLRHHNPKDPKRCPKRDWEAEAEEEELGATERLDTTGMSPRELVAIHGLKGLEVLMRQRLTEYLKSAPTVGKKTVNWIIKQWESDEAVRRDPNMLYSILTESGVDSKIAWRITNAINSLLQEYQHLLKAPQHPFQGGRFTQQPTPPGFFQGPFPTQFTQPFYPQQPLTGYPQGYTPPGFFSQDQVNRMRNDWLKESKLEKMEEKIGEVIENFRESMTKLEEKIIGKLDAATTPEGKYEEVKEFVDEEGKLCDPEKAVSMRLRRIPVASKESTELVALRQEVKSVLEAVQNKEISSIKEEVTKLREERKNKPTEETETVKKLRETLDDQRKSIESLKTTIQDKDRAALIDKINGLERKLGDIANRDTSEWKTDEMRAISSGIHDIKEIVAAYLKGGKRPLDRVEGWFFPGAGAGAPPTTSGARGPVIEELRKKNLTVPR